MHLRKSDSDFRYAGIYAIDVNGTQVTGTAYSVVTGETETITGSVTNGTDLSATTADGTSITGTIGTALSSLNATATLTGSWNNASADGSFAGDGCRLN